MVSGRDSPPKMPDIPHGSYASVNLYAPHEGFITHLDPAGILSRPWVKGVVLKKQVGDHVSLPPSDYDNRLIGYCIVNSGSERDLPDVGNSLKQLLHLSIQTGGRPCL
jgi:hypothetical protein